MRCLLSALFVLGLLTIAQPALGCPNCKDSIAGGDTSAAGPDAGTPGGVSSGFNLSIYLMFVALFGTTALVTVTIVRGARGVSSRKPDETDNHDEPDEDSTKK